jgi:hypothetical protein
METGGAARIVEGRAAVDWKTPRTGRVARPVGES